MTGLIYNGTDLKRVEYEDSYEFIKKGVKGHFEHLDLYGFNEKGLDVWVNEDGKFQNLDATGALFYNGDFYDLLVGNIVFTRRDDEGETISLTEDDCLYINQFFIRGEYVIIDNKLLKLFNY